MLPTFELRCNDRGIRKPHAIVLRAVKNCPETISCESSLKNQLPTEAPWPRTSRTARWMVTSTNPKIAEGGTTQTPINKGIRIIPRTNAPTSQPPPDNKMDPNTNSRDRTMDTRFPNRPPTTAPITNSVAILPAVNGGSRSSRAGWQSLVADIGRLQTGPPAAIHRVIVDSTDGATDVRGGRISPGLPPGETGEREVRALRPTMMNSPRECRRISRD